MDAFNHDDIKALDELYLQVGMYQSHYEIKTLYQFLRRFHQWAPFNAMLLHIQKPGSVFVASATEWQRKFNRTIKPGARPLVVLWPFSPVRFVFELGDTEGDAPFPEELLHPFKVDGHVSSVCLNRLLENLARDGIGYYETSRGTHSAGSIRKLVPSQSILLGKNNKRIRVNYCLEVNSAHSNAEKLATIVHELGHLYCGHLGVQKGDWWEERLNVSLNSREFEAESVAWLVCERMGLDNPSAAYLHEYLEAGREIPPISLEAILKAAGKVEQMLTKLLPIRKALELDH